ncbi:MAG: hypothetical protein J3R72DRAFT_485208 [Linnemannia gamsii]|nr:MAG: hypothetical protein J3R72DRAFT_485208 [Linnemannia gamsii]
MDKSTSIIRIQRHSSSLPEDDHPEDMEFIVTWMEHYPNFESVLGSRGETPVGMPNKCSSRGYRTLADAVSSQSKGRLAINGKSMRGRFQRHMKVYTSTKVKAKSRGFGITERDTRNGVYTMGHNMESMCTCYARMDALFGSRPNGNPVCRGEPPTQEQNERQEFNTVPSHRYRLIDDDEEEEEEEEEEDGDATNTFTRDDNADNRTIDNSFDNDVADFREDSLRETNDIDGDERSVYSMSPPIFQRQSKRQLTYAESPVSNKRSQTTDRRKRPPTLEPGFAPEMSRWSHVGSYGPSVVKKPTALETLGVRKAEMELERLEMENAREAKKLESEEKRLEMEWAREEKLLEMGNAREAERLDREERKLRLEERKLEKDAQREVLRLMATGVAQDMSLEQIKELVKLTTIQEVIVIKCLHITVFITAFIAVNLFTLLKVHILPRITEAIKHVMEHTACCYPSAESLHNRYRSNPLSHLP